MTDLGLRLALTLAGGLGGLLLGMVLHTSATRTHGHGLYGTWD